MADVGRFDPASNPNAAASVSRSAPPRLADVQAGLVPALAAGLTLSAPPAGVSASASNGPTTVVAAGPPPVTRTGRAGAESLDVRGADGSSASRLRSFTAAMTAGASPPPTAGPSNQLADPVLQPGELVLLDLPDVRRDDRATRPTLAAVQGSARVVVLHAGGGVTSDTLLADGQTVSPPVGTARIAVTPALAAGGTPSLAGWHAGQQLPYVGLGALLCSGAVLRVAGRGTRRASRRVRSGHVLAADLVGGLAAVTTTFAGPVAAVAVVVEGGPPEAADLGLSGATLAPGSDGTAAAPTVVASGARGAVVAGVIPAGSGPVEVTVSSSADRRIVAVVGLTALSAASGGPADPAAAVVSLAAGLAGAGVEALTGTPLAAGAAPVLIQWKEPRCLDAHRPARSGCTRASNRIPRPVPMCCRAM